MLGCFAVQVKWAAYTSFTDVTGAITSIPSGPACDKCWTIAFDHLNSDSWGAFLAFAETQEGAKIVLACHTAFPKYRQAHPDAEIPNESVVKRLGTIVEIDEAYEVKTDGECRDSIHRARLNQSITAGVPSVDLSQLGLASDALVFQHPTLPPRTLHVKKQFLIARDDNMLSAAELAWPRHAECFMGRQGKYEDCLLVGLFKHTDVKWDFNSWVTKNDTQAALPPDNNVSVAGTTIRANILPSSDMSCASSNPLGSGSAPQMMSLASMPPGTLLTQQAVAAHTAKSGTDGAVHSVSPSKTYGGAAASLMRMKSSQSLPDDACSTIVDGGQGAANQTVRT